MAGELWRQFEGQVIENKYHLQGLISTGSYGGVFLADHLVKDRLIRRVAVKLMTPEGDAEELLRELSEATNLHHPNLLRCFDAGQCVLRQVEVFYLVMEIATDSLQQILRVRPLAEQEAREWLLSTTTALDYLHAHQMVHCDVKPGNLLRVGDVWKLSDFGLLRSLAHGALTRTTSLLGSAAYMPPEGYDGVISPAWDIWSLGITLVEALTQRRPFQAQTEAELQRQILGELAWVPELPGPFREIARGCLIKDPRKRWTLAQIQTALRPPAAPVVLTPPPVAAAPAGTGSSRQRKEVNRLAWLWALALLPMVLLAVVLFAPRRHENYPMAEQRTADPTAVRHSQPETPKPVVVVPKVEETKPVETVAPPPAATPTNEREERGAIYALLDDWVDSTRSKNLALQVSCYAPVLTRYFTKRDVPLSTVQRDKEAWFNDFDEVRQFELKNVTIDALNTTEAAVSFDKSWDIVGKLRNAGSERERLLLAKIDGRWKIAGEEEQQVYWTKKEAER